MALEKYDKHKDSGIEWIGEIPVHWTVNRIKYLTEYVKTGSTPPTDSKEYFEDGRIDWYGPSDFNCLELRESKKKVTTKAIDDGKCKLYKKDSILLVGIGATVGKIGITRKTCTSNQQINAIKFKENLIDATFAVNYLSAIKDVIVSKSDSATLPIFNQTQTKELSITLPPLPEQTAIANYLDHKTAQIDDLISKKQRLIALLQEERTAIINQAVTKGIDPNVPMKDSGIEWLGEIPAHWEVKKLNYLADKIGDGLHGTPIYVDTSNYSFINGNNIGNGTINFYESTKFISENEYERHKKELNENTILMSINGTIGNLAYYNSENVMLGKSVAYINCKAKTNKEFIYTFLETQVASIYINKELSGSTIKNLSLYTINKTPIPYPSAEEQIAIVNHITIEKKRIYTICDKVMSEINLLKEYKTALISEVVTGKVKITE